MADTIKGHRSVGTKLLIGTEQLRVAGLSSISGLELSADTIDVTTLDSDAGYREFIGGFKDAGEVSLEGFFLEDEGQTMLYDLFKSGAVESFVIMFPDATKSSWEFNGVVTAVGTNASLEDAIAFTATIKVSGEPTLKITA